MLTPYNLSGESAVKQFPRIVVAAAIWLTVSCTGTPVNSRPPTERSHALRSRETPSPSVPAQVFAPSPREDCPVGIPRGGRPLKASGLLAAFDGYLSHWMPQGFGLFLARTEAEGIPTAKRTVGYWTDAGCREIFLSYFRGALGYPTPKGRPLGPWVVTAETPSGCGNAVLGSSPCLWYEANVRTGVLALNVMGFSIAEGDQIALSISSSS